jgi:uncharacterized protein YecE (DUF72 family)
MNGAALRIGTAGWSLPPAVRASTAIEGSGLARYASLFPAVEINSSFYRPHRQTTYSRWASATPPGFRFAVKAPKTVTHERRLADTDQPLGAFLGEVAGLGVKLGVILLQLPPSLAFDEASQAFIARWRDRFGGPTAIEPRHPSWFTPAVDQLLDRAQIARVAADPAVTSNAGDPGGWPGLTYFRLHGSPRMYASPYDEAAISGLRRRLAERPQGTEGWCVFDNTMFGAAASDALSLLKDPMSLPAQAPQPGPGPSSSGSRSERPAPAIRPEP